MVNELFYTSSNNSGIIFHRVTEDIETLEEVKEMIMNGNSDLDGYQPELALIVTWFNLSLQEGRSVSKIIVELRNSLHFPLCLETDDVSSCSLY